jgi:hypothetical protein
MSPARVFISCGQSKGTDEPRIAKEISVMLEALGYEPYIAVEETTFAGVKENIFERLKNSEYFLFIDFKREPLGDGCHRGSLFSNQELAIAAWLDMKVIALQEEGVKQLDGLLHFMQTNASIFIDKGRLPEQIAEAIRKAKWNPSWKNELLLHAPQPKDSLNGFKCFHVQVRNQHSDKVALNCSGYLERIVKLPNVEIELPDEKLECKWAATAMPRISIPARSARKYDAAQIRYIDPVIVSFPTITDSPGYTPTIPYEPGRYELSYLVTSDNFPVKRGIFILDVRATVAETTLEMAPA